MTSAEVLLPRIGCYGLASYIAAKHYVGGLHGPGAKEFMLAKIDESGGDAKRAEEWHWREIKLRTGSAEPHVSLGQFFARQGSTSFAIRALEEARNPRSTVTLQRLVARS
jgi:hypothetical protein